MNLFSLFHGEKVRLSAITPEDVPTLTLWYQDVEFMRLFDSLVARPRTEEEIQKWRNDWRNDKDSYMFGIRTVLSDELVGLIDIGGISWQHGVGWLGVAIGDRANRGRGYGTEAVTLLLDFAFRELNLYRVQLNVFSYNTAAIRVYEKLGFTQEGILRQALHRDGQRYDILMYGLLRPEWEK